MKVILSSVLGAIIFLCSLSCSVPLAAPKQIKQARYSVATLEIQAEVLEGQWRSMGSGTVFSIAPHILITAGHVCDGYYEASELYLGARMRMKYILGSSFFLDDTDLVVIKTDDDNDLCMLYSHSTILDPLPLAEDKLQFGDKLFILGAPMGVPHILTDGYYSHEEDCADKRKDPKKVIPCMILSTPAFFGNSGGPIINSEGEVVGVLVAGAMRYPNISVGVPMVTLRPFVGNAIAD